MALSLITGSGGTALAQAQIGGALSGMSTQAGAMTPDASPMPMPAGPLTPTPFTPSAPEPAPAPPPPDAVPAQPAPAR
jgi:hypothetical protein